MYEQHRPGRAARPTRRPPHRAAFGLGCLAAVLASACGDGGGTATTTAPPTASTIASTSSPSTSSPSTTQAPTTAATTAPPTVATVPTTPAVITSPPGFPFVADTVEVPSAYFTQPFVMRVAASADGIRAYEGTSTDGAYTARCVAIVRDGIDAWNEWCGDAGRDATFVVLDGIDPWLVEVHADPVTVTLARQPSDWALVSNGCAEPIVSIVAAATLGPSTAAGVWCAGDEAIVDVASVLLQPGPADGGRALLGYGGEGWNLLDTGTSLDCGAYPGGADRCALFESAGELPGAFPMPPTALLPVQADVVGLADDTAAMRAAAGAATAVGDIADAIVASLTPSDAEAEPTVRFVADPGGRSVDALAVEVPQLDDSVRATVHVVWIRRAIADQPAGVARSFVWNVCARGRADAATCI